MIFLSNIGNSCFKLRTHTYTFVHCTHTNTRTYNHKNTHKNAGKSKRYLGRACALAEQAIWAWMLQYSFCRSKIGGETTKVTKMHVNAEVLMSTAVATLPTMLIIAAQQSDALELSYTTMADWRKWRCLTWPSFLERTSCLTKRLLSKITKTSQVQQQMKNQATADNGPWPTMVAPCGRIHDKQSCRA